MLILSGTATFSTRGHISGDVCLGNFWLKFSHHQVVSNHLVYVVCYLEALLLLVTSEKNALSSISVVTQICVISYFLWLIGHRSPSVSLKCNIVLSCGSCFVSCGSCFVAKRQFLADWNIISDRINPCRDWTSLVIVANCTILNVNRMGILLHCNYYVKLVYFWLLIYPYLLVNYEMEDLDYFNI